MNKNIPSAVATIRALLDSDGDVAAAIAHALDGQGLLVDPMKTFGAVLRRTREGWEPVTPTAPAPTTPAGVADTMPIRIIDQAAEQLVDDSLEQQARAWDRVCDRARTLAGHMAKQYAAEPDVTRVTADRDTVLVSLHITDADRWARWMTAFGLTDAQLERAGDYAVVGRTTWDGVPLSVLAYDVPEVQAHIVAQARRPYVLDGRVYDLALPYKDRDGDVWFHEGELQPEGMPLMRVDGRPERCTLANIVRVAGPLNAVRELLDVVPGGERA
ncbi:BN159_2729 family protein [Streptomyces sp. NPDC087894]|uniref:BN159_2729 family protein n=1 Tax=Streptomyces sp. NPDC087894 TaxID=3365816 RepID=UPI003805F0C7